MLNKLFHNHYYQLLTINSVSNIFYLSTFHISLVDYYFSANLCAPKFTFCVLFYRVRCFLGNTVQEQPVPPDRKPAGI